MTFSLRVFENQCHTLTASTQLFITRYSGHGQCYGNPGAMESRGPPLIPRVPTKGLGGNRMETFNERVRSLTGVRRLNLTLLYGETTWLQADSGPTTDDDTHPGDDPVCTGTYTGKGPRRLYIPVNTLHASVGLHERLGSDVQNDVKLTQPTEATLGCQRVRVQRPRVNLGDMSGEGTLAEAWGLGTPPLP